MIVCCAANAPAANRQSPQSKDRYGRRFTIPRSMAVMQDSTATMLSRLLERNEAVGKKSNGSGHRPNHRRRRLTHSEHFEDKTMFLSSFDILRKDRRGKPILVAVVGDLETARLRLSQLASLMPGEYFVFDPRTQQIVAAVEDSQWQVT
jgi:hypothetical protein